MTVIYRVEYNSGRVSVVNRLVVNRSRPFKAISRKLAPRPELQCLEIESFRALFLRRGTLDYASTGRWNGLEFHHRIPVESGLAPLSLEDIVCLLKDIDICVWLLRAFVARWQKQLENLAKDPLKRSTRWDISDLISCKIMETISREVHTHTHTHTLSFSLTLFLSLSLCPPQILLWSCSKLIARGLSWHNNTYEFPHV